MNLFRILCDLTQMSFIRAHEYSRAMHDRQYVSHTILQNAPTFRNSLNVFQELQERRVFQFLQLKVDAGGRSKEEMSQLLARCVRTNDVAGVLEDGSIWLLLSQAGDEDLKFILPRFQRLGLSAQVAQVPDWCDMPVQETVLTEITETPLEEITDTPLTKIPESSTAKEQKNPPAKSPRIPPTEKRPVPPVRKAAPQPARRFAAARRTKSAKNKLGLGNLLDSLLGGRRW